MREDAGDFNWSETLRAEGWLCPALFRYFSKSACRDLCQSRAAGELSYTRDTVPTAALGNLSNKPIYQPCIHDHFGKLLGSDDYDPFVVRFALAGMIDKEHAVEGVEVVKPLTYSSSTAWLVSAFTWTGPFVRARQDEV